MEKFPKTPKPSKTLEDVLKARGEGGPSRPARRADPTCRKAKDRVWCYG